MRNWILALFIALPLAAQNNAAKPQTPKLVVAIVIDQFRYDYLTRFHSEYTGGFKRFFEHGAVFTNAHFEHVPTVTAVGHSTFLSGATPAMSGIIGNEWWDRASKKRVTSVSDEETKLLGSTGEGASPNRLLQSTVGDEMKISGRGGKVVGVSIKDRAAILPSGHMADGAYWFDGKTGNFVSSTFYFASLPEWVSQFNASRPADKYAGQTWMGKTMAAMPDAKFYAALDATPYGNELILQFAEKAIVAEKLGMGSKTDLLTVSFSANDYVGHALGAESEESHDMALRVDKLVGELIRTAEAQAGVGRVLAVLTADHGVAPVPETNQKRKMPGGRFDEKAELDAVEKALTARFGALKDKWIAYSGEGSLFFTDPNLRDIAEVERVAADTIRALPHVFRVYTRTQLMNGAILEDAVGVRMRNGFNQARSGNVIVMLDPYWMVSRSGTTHGAPFDYDTHVPMMFLGPQVRAGRYNSNVMVNDIAPTLATMLDVETPSGSVGRVLDEMLIK
ncbi:MAG TPA: alkaline phosphatase family protein [Bryobacteraceae bacterium]|nr:alkaline phosphatase family protein [Bryobacteraceae bacterium]